MSILFLDKKISMAYKITNMKDIFVDLSVKTVTI